LILVSVLIICIEALLMEKRKKSLAIKVAEVAKNSGEDNNLQKTSGSQTTQKRLSI
jgi:formyltetrahydrofolate hydrolase